MKLFIPLVPMIIYAIWRQENFLFLTLFIPYGWNSSGEKQLLTILMTVLLEDGDNTLRLMDEPEVSLHIEWQQELIDTILLLNPNVQIILSTHSPAIIMNGWMDKVTEVSDITL